MWIWYTILYFKTKISIWVNGIGYMHAENYI